MKQSEYFDEKILEKVNTENSKYYTLIEFDNALNELSTKKLIHALYTFSVLSRLPTGQIYVRGIFIENSHDIFP